MTVTFDVIGDPRPQGSKRHVGNGVMIESAGEQLRTWRALVADAARANLPERPLEGPIGCRLVFHLPRPKSRRRSVWSQTRPDVDKLARGVLDALTAAGAIDDDARIAKLSAEKRYALEQHWTGCSIGLWEMG